MGLVVMGVAGSSPVTTSEGQKPSRIVTLAPSVGEIAADCLGEDLTPLVGVSDYTDEPAALKSKPSVGAYHQFNLERVKTLKPDLVLAVQEGNSRDQVLHLRQLGIRIVVVEGGSLENISKSFETVCQAVGFPERGVGLKAQFLRGLDRIKAEAANFRKRQRVFLQIGDRPTITAGRASFLNDVLLAVGAENVFGDQPAAYPKISTEEVVKRNPDVILVLAMGRTPKEIQVFNLMASRWYDFPELTAARTKRIEVVTSDVLVRPTLRLLEGMDRLQKKLKKWSQ